MKQLDNWWKIRKYKPGKEWHNYAIPQIHSAFIPHREVNTNNVIIVFAYRYNYRSVRKENQSTSLKAIKNYVK